MSGVLHPVGPEAPRTYWIRRGILLAVVLLLALGVVLAVANLTKAAVVSTQPPTVLPADTPSPTSTPADSTPAGAESGATPAASASAPTPATSSSATSATTPVPSTSSAAKPSASTSASASAQPKPTTTTVGTPDCKAADLRVTLKGDKSLAAGKKNAFTLSLINGGASTCLASVTDKNFELKIYSGKDRIWSSKDCTKVLADFDKKLASQADVDWTMTWNGKRSVKGEKCDYASAKPQPGTYWATAQLKGADPVQLRMILS